jgi:heme A synthase
MREFRFACATALSTFGLLVIGGLVHATGSSLACPDWPLCYGQAFPKMEGGILYEHGHRLAALWVGTMTVGLAALVWKHRSDPVTRSMAWLAVGLVLFQAALGAITVRLKLPLLVSTGHLATSMAFFSLLIAICFRLRPAPRPGPPSGPRSGQADVDPQGGPRSGRAEVSPCVRRITGLAALATYLQLVLGGFVRHTGAGLACNAQFPLCNDAWLPSGGPAWLHLSHRLMGMAVVVVIVAASVGVTRAIRSTGSRVPPGIALLVWAGPALAALQIALGVATVLSFIAIPWVTAHLAGGALLLANALSLHLAMRPLTAAPEPHGERRRAPQPAAEAA